MIPMQIRLTAEQAGAVKRAAAARGISMSAVIREVLDRSAEVRADDALWRRALAAVGRYSGGPRNVSEEHDRVLADAYVR